MLCIKFNVSERGKSNGEDASDLFGVQYTDDVELLLDVFGELIEFFVKIVLFVVRICSADYDPVLVLPRELFFMIHLFFH